jgi:ubiquitin carboxyl-terminal hydrolase 5/13
MLLEFQKHDSASKQDKVQVWEEQRPVSKYALGLHQEASTGKTIPSDPSQWACAETGVKENLWLNLSTGTIGSGRQASTMTGCCMLMPKAVYSTACPCQY